MENSPKSQGVIGDIQKFPKIVVGNTSLTGKIGILGGVRSCQYPFAMSPLLSFLKHSNKMGEMWKKAAI